MTTETIETYPSLYKRDSAGKMRVWYMQREGCKHRVVAGIEDGSLVENAWTECVSKGKGKAQTTPEEQAIKEVEALYEKGLKRDYYATREEANGPARNYLPMLAQSWKDTTWEKWTQRIAKAAITLNPGETGVYFQPKLDGYCCIAKASGLQSREGLPILTAPHVEAALKPFFDQHPDSILHGELYNHDLKDEFEKLGSLLKKQKGITQEHIDEVAAKIQFHIYDYPGVEHLPFGDRSTLLYINLAFLGIWGDTIRYVDTTPVHDEEHLLELTAQALEDGYEGGIGRLYLPYEKAKRSWSVIKIKTFEDDEFFLVRTEEGKGNYAGYAKRAIFWRKGADRTQEPTKDNTFEAGIKGKKNQRLKDLLTETHLEATVTYFGYTQNGAGVPRMGVAKVFHGPEGRML